MVSASCGIEPTRTLEYKPMLDKALELATHKPGACVIVQRPQVQADLHDARDVDWDAMKAGASDPAGCVEVAATDPLYVLYTSGTTGKPNGIVRDNGGHPVALAWQARRDPDAGQFWRVVAEYGVEAMFTAPTAIRAIKKEDPNGEHLAQHDTSSLRTLFLAGERLDPDTYEWATKTLGVPVVDNWWQTETGWPIAANLRGLEPMQIKPGSPTVAVPGGTTSGSSTRPGSPTPAGTEGAICLRLPLPPGTLPTLWGDDERYVASYLSAFGGHYLTGDGGYVDEDGYLYVMGRTDDVIKVAGHRLSTGSMETVIAHHPAVAECAVIGAADPMKGQVPRGFVVLKAGVTEDPEDVARELVAMVREEIGAVAAFKDVQVVGGLRCPEPPASALTCSINDE